MKKVLINCSLIGISNSWTSNDKEMKEYAFVVNEPYNYSQGKSVFNTIMSTEKFNRLCADLPNGKIVGPINIYLEDYQNDRKLRATSFWPYDPNYKKTNQ